MKSKLLLLSVLLSTLVLALPAKANNYDFEFLSSTYDVSGVITTANTTNGISNGTSLGYDILAISGSISGVGGGAITSLVANPAQPNPTNNGAFLYDNVGFPATEPYLDSNGVLFTVGGSTWNLWGNGSGDYELYSYSPQVDVHGTMTLSAIPEPETYAMMLAGLGLMGFIARRRKQNGAAA